MSSATSRLDYAKTINQYLSDHIKFADAKAGSILTFSALLLGAISTQVASRLLELPQHRAMALACGVLALASVGTAALVILYALRALSPKAVAAESLNSFPDIAKLSESEFTAKVLALGTEDEILQQYARHNWALACVANTKFAFIRDSVIWLKWFIALAVSLAILLLAARLV